MSSQATIAGDAVSAPRSTGIHKPQQFATSSTPAQSAAWSGLDPDPVSNFFITVKAIGADVRFWFKTDSGSISITSSTGYLLKDGSAESFWVNATLDNYIEHYSASNAVLEITITSPLSSKVK